MGKAYKLKRLQSKIVENRPFSRYPNTLLNEEKLRLYLYFHPLDPTWERNESLNITIQIR
jgi:hypothetical protein